MYLTDNFVNCYLKYQHIGKPERFDHRKVSTANATIYIVDSNISFGKSCDDIICNFSASGLTLVFNQFLYTVELHINNVTLQDNVGGGNILLNSTSCSRVFLLNFTNISSKFSAIYSGDQGYYGLQYNEIQCSCKAAVVRRILVSQSLFNQSCFYAELHDYLGLAAGVTYTTVYLKYTNISYSNCTSALELRSIYSVALESVEVTSNTGPFSLQVVNRLRLQKRHYSITLSGSCIFRNNKGGISVRGDYVRLLRSTHLRFAENSTTVINQNTVCDQMGKQYGATMYLSDAVVEFLEGSCTEFVNNHALLSGGITAIRSQMWFLDNPNLVFISNTGSYGGAIGLYEKSGFFFYQSNATIEFRNNSAANYGGGLYVDDSSYLERISNQYVSPYFSVYCCKLGICPRLKQLERIQIVGQNCTQLRYTPSSLNPKEKLKLTVSNRQRLRFADMTIKDLSKNPKYKLQFTDLYLDIKFKCCPFGFKFNISTGLCTCISLHLSSTFDLYCKQHQNLFQLYRKEITWAGVYNLLANNKTLSPNNGTLVFGLCPFNYCKMNETAINLATLNEQCDFNWSGILCGGCQENLSRVFVTFSCKDCSGTRTIPMVIGYALCGIALIALLFILNLTISVGTINSLIFYANIAGADRVSAFLPHEFSNSFLYKFFSLLNLGTGIESCFYDGMSTYTLSWILFVFPFYIWLLSAIIIAVSHYSSRASRLFGKNAVQVLATLFLLSYATLLEITIANSALAFTTIYSVNGPAQHVWLLDGNIPYMGKKHAPLFVATMLLLVFICIPYSVTLTLVQWLQRYSHKCILRWILKLKPFIDAHTGPYKDKHRYWPGFLLLVRAGTFFLFTLNTRTNQRVNAALVTVISVCLIFYLLFIRGVYKSRLLNIIEVSFLLNLLILSISSLFQEIFTLHISLYIAYMSVGSAFVYTCLILVYHAAVRISTTPLGDRMKGIILPILCGTVKKRFNYERLIAPVVSDNERESSTVEARSPLSIGQRVTHSSIAIRDDEPFLSDTYRC